MRVLRSLVVVVLGLGLVQTPARAAIQLLSNGDFSGGLASWTVTDQAGSSGSWFSSTVGAATPVSGHTTSAVNNAGAAAAGSYVVTDQGGPGTHALTQGFTVPGGSSSVMLSFDMFVNDADSGPIFNPSGLDFTSGGTFAPNQQGRVDILTAGATAFDTGAGVLANYYLGIDPHTTIPNPFTHYLFDITSLVGAGGTFQLRFAEADNSGFFNMGVDNASVMYTAGGAVPEPLSLVVWTTLAGLGICVAARARRG